MDLISIRRLNNIWIRCGWKARALNHPDWIAGNPKDLRAWRNAQPDVVSPVMPTDVCEAAIPANGAFPGGLIFSPPESRPDSGPDTVIVHFHGGGFIVGSPETHRVVSAWISSVLKCRVLSPRYRLAPEHTLPAQADDAVAALDFAAGNIAPSIILTGDSAGALVSLWGYSFAAIKLRKAIRATCLFYGVYGAPPTDTPTHARFERDGLGPRTIRSKYHRLDPGGKIDRLSGFTPMDADFDLPPNLTIIGAGADPLLEHSLWLHQRPGCDAELIVAKDLAHGFLSAAQPDPRAMAILSELNRSLF